MNVLVTRAREEVHLVTSIPPEHYRALPPIPEGQTPGGAWLLFSYLAYAEFLSERYEDAHEERAQARGALEVQIRASDTAARSRLSEAMAMECARRGVGGHMYWGNDGFCIDVALDHPTRQDDVTVGLLTDLTRFRGAADPVEWELFRTMILQSQGWELHRVWSPTIFRDLTGVHEGIHKTIAEHLRTDEDPDALRSWRDAGQTDA